MSKYDKLVEVLRTTERICRDRMDGQAMLDAADAIEALQAETVRLWPKRGKWINSKERMRPDMCSVCGCIYEADRFMDKIAWNYCPNCGAKMEVHIIKSVTMREGDTDTDGFFRKAVEAVTEVRE